MPEGTDAMKDWILVISQRGQSSHTVPFSTDIVFGRSSSCSCVLNDAAVSGNHARIIEKDGQVLVEDLGSENKTHISDGPTLGKGDTHVLAPGTVIQMGRTFVELRNPGILPKTAAVDPPSTATQQAPPPDSQATMANDGVPPPDPYEGAETQVGSPVDPDVTMLRPEDPPAPAPAPAPTRPSAPTLPSDATLAAGNMEESGYEGTIDFGAGGGSGLHARLAANGSLQAARARIVIASQMDRRVDAIATTTFAIGRGQESHCRLTHPAISTPHATISFKPEESRFFIEDEGSRNHTYLDGQLLASGAQHELKSNAHVRFGPVDALFVVEIDPDGVKIPEKRQKLAAQLLVENGTITASAEASASKMAVASDQQLGETLLLSPEPLTVKQWVDALEQAKYLEISGGLRREQRRVWVVAAAVLALVVLIVIIMTQV